MVVFQRDCFNLLWVDLEAALHVIRNRVENPDDAQTSPGGKKAKRSIERFRWEIKKKGQVVKKGSQYFLTMKRCIVDAKMVKLGTNENIDYIAEDWEYDSKMDVIERVFVYLLRHDYDIMSYFKCHGCKASLITPENHEGFCLKADETLVDPCMARAAHMKIQNWRLIEAVNMVASEYNIGRVEREEINEFLSGVTSEIYTRILEINFEAELGLLDDIHVSI